MRDSILTPPQAIMWPAILLTGIALLNSLTEEEPLDSARPALISQIALPTSQAVTDFKTTHARLWEDPLLPTYLSDHITDGGEKPGRQKENAAADPTPATHDLTRDGLAPDLPVVDSQPIQQVTETPTKLASGVAQPNRSAIGELITRVLNGPSTAEQSIGTGRRGKFFLLPVLVPGGPTLESHEQRLRIRYAVVSGLAQGGLLPAKATALSAFSADIKVENCDAIPPITTRSPMLVPFEFFSRTAEGQQITSAQDNVLVWWLNEEQLGDQPLQVLNELLLSTGLNKDLGQIHLAIVGPSSSDTLSLMATEACNGMCESYRAFAMLASATMYCGRPTIEAPDTFEADARSEQLHCLRLLTQPGKIHFHDANAPGAQQRGLKVIRTIGTDAQLVRALRNELRLRRAWPDGDQSGRHVVVLTERDTAYGQALPDTLRAELSNDCEQCADSKNLHVFRYLRGLDGRAPPPPSNAQNDSQASTATVEQAFGTKQLDYLRRLTRQLIELRRTLSASRNGDIVSIGVLGSDPYDKLLILKAVRKHFPAAVFFTTDLDERLASRQELKHTQNLLIASHFGLALSPELQGDVPPFRDSYQTSTYFSILNALNDPRVRFANNQEDPWGLRSNGDNPLEPLMFEIGRQGAYQLTKVDSRTSGLVASTLKNSKVIQPHSPRETSIRTITIRAAWFVTIVGCLVLLLSVYVKVVGDFTSGVWDSMKRMTRLRPVARDWVCCGVCVGVALLAGAIMFDHIRDDGEPFSLVDGISVWPSTLLRVAAIVLSVAFLLKARRDLGRAFDKIAHMAGVKPSELKRRGDLYSRAGLIAPRRLNSLRARKILAASLISKWRPNVAPIAQSIPMFELLREYDSREASIPKVLRVLPVIALFTLFGLLLLGIADYPHSPSRGFLSFAISETVLYLSLFMLIVLVFVVLDSSKCCTRFIRKLVNDSVSWRATARHSVMQNRGLPNADGVSELLTMQTIAVCTRDVGKLVLYPFIVVLILFVARKGPYDSFDYPIGLILLLAFSLLWIFISALALRREAYHAREEMLRRLNPILSQSLAGRRQSHPQQLKQIAEEIRTEQRGSFVPVLEDPIFKAIAIPFGGVGGLTLLEELLRRA